MKRTLSFKIIGLTDELKLSINNIFCTNMWFNSAEYGNRVITELYEHKWKEGEKDKLLLTVEIRFTDGCDTVKKAWGHIKAGLMKHINEYDCGSYKGKIEIVESLPENRV